MTLTARWVTLRARWVTLTARWVTFRMTAPQAAGVIHGDFERGFIRAETVAYNDFVECKGLTVAKEKVRASWVTQVLAG